MRQILASFFCFGENLVKSNEVKTNLTKRSFIERKIRQFVTLQKPRAEDEEDHHGQGETSHEAEAESRMGTRLGYLY